MSHRDSRLEKDYPFFLGGTDQCLVGRGEGGLGILGDPEGFRIIGTQLMPMSQIFQDENEDTRVPWEGLFSEISIAMGLALRGLVENE